jgi:hypothetical protein
MTKNVIGIIVLGLFILALLCRSQAYLCTNRIDQLEQDAIRARKERKITTVSDAKKRKDRLRTLRRSSMRALDLWLYFVLILLAPLCVYVYEMLNEEEGELSAAQISVMIVMSTVVTIGALIGSGTSTDSASQKPKKRRKKRRSKYRQPIVEDALYYRAQEQSEPT